MWLKTKSGSLLNTDRLIELWIEAPKGQLETTYLLNATFGVTDQGRDWATVDSFPTQEAAQTEIDRLHAVLAKGDGMPELIQEVTYKQ